MYLKGAFQMKLIRTLVIMATTFMAGSAVMAQGDCGGGCEGDLNFEKVKKQKQQIRINQAQSRRHKSITYDQNSSTISP